MARPTNQPPGGPGTQGAKGPKGSPPRNGPRPTPPGGQAPPSDPVLRQRALAALVLGLLSVIGLLLMDNVRRAVFVASVTLLFGCVAIWLGATASKRARRGGTARPPGSILGVVLGSLGLAASTSWLLALALFWPQLSTYAACVDSANTVAAQQTCRDQLTTSIGNEFSVLQSSK